MPRIKLKKNSSYEFQYRTQIKVRDLNYAGHLGNDSLVGILHEARADLFNHLNAAELDLGDGTTGIVLTDLVINYLGEGHMFDELTVMSHVDEIEKTGFRVFHYAINENRPIALAESGIRAFDYQKRKIVKIPKIFLDRLNQFIKAIES